MEQPTEIAPKDHPATALEDPLLTVAQAAAGLAVSEKHIRRLIETRQIACVRLGRTVRLRRRDIEALIDTHTIDAIDWAREVEPRR